MDTKRSYKTLIYVVLAFIMMNIGLAATGNKTQFDDTSGSGLVLNYTYSDLSNTRVISIPGNSSINISQLNITGLSKFDVRNTLSVPFDTIYGISYIPDSNEFYATAKNSTIYRLNSDGTYKSSINVNITNCNPFIALNFGTAFYGIKAMSNDTLFVISHNSSANGENNVYQLNYTRTDSYCIDWWQLSLKETINNTRGITVDDAENFAWISTRSTPTYIVKLNISKCLNEMQCYSSGINWSFTKNEIDSPNLLSGIDTINNGSSFYATGSWLQRLYAFDSSYNILNSTFLFILTSESGTKLQSDMGYSFNGSTHLITENDDLLYFVQDVFPKNIDIYVNGTTIFSHQTTLLGSNVTDLNNNSAFDNCLSNFQSCNVVINTTSPGKIQVDGLFVKYNKTNTAILTITAPQEITATATIGDTIGVIINITNSGDYTATDLNVSSYSSLGIPNLNSILTANCTGTNMSQSQSISCNLVFTNVQQAAEPDERIKVCAVGTDNSETICSNAIDLDIETTSATGGQSGGGGSSSIKQKEAKFDIVGVNSFNQDTAQLSIRPSSERTYCLEAVNYADETQEIFVECDNPSGSRVKACSWIKIEREYIEMQPSEQIRERFCMTITTPFNVMVGERYVVNIKGTATSPSKYKNTKDIHSITMWVTDPSFFFRAVYEKLNETTVMDAFFVTIKKYFKEDIRTFQIKNFYNPFLLGIHVLAFFMLRVLNKKAKLYFHIILQIAFLIFSITSMFYPVVLFWLYIIVVLLLSWSALINRLIPSRSRKLFKQKA